MTTLREHRDNILKILTLALDNCIETSEDRPDQLDFDRVTGLLRCFGKTTSGETVEVASVPVLKLNEPLDDQFSKDSVFGRPSFVKSQTVRVPFLAFGIMKFHIAAKTESGSDRPQYKLVLHHMADRFDLLVSKARFDSVEIGQEMDVEVRALGSNVLRRNEEEPKKCPGCLAEGDLCTNHPVE